MAVDGLGAIEASSNDGLAEAMDSFNETFEGLTEVLTQDEGFAELDSTMQDIAKQVATLCDQTDPDNNDETPFEDVMNSFFGAEAETKKGQRGKGKLVDKPDQIMDLPTCYSLPAILIWSKLDSIEKKMTKMGEDDSGGKKKSGGLGNIFKGLMEGAVGIVILAAGLLIFAGALVVFGIIQWGPALLGMLAFTLFVLGAIELAKHVKKHLDDFIQLAIGSAILAGALLIFAFALMVCGKLTLEMVMKGILVAGLFLVFAYAAGMVSNAVKSNMANFVSLAVGSALMAVGLMIFAVALMVCGAVTLQAILKGILVCGLFLLFTLGVVVLGNMVQASMASFISMAIGAGLMAVALMVFALALLVAGIIGRKILEDKTVALSAILIMGIFLGFVALGALMAPAAPALLLFAAASILLSIGLMLFSLAVLFVANVLKPELVEKFVSTLPGMMAIFLGMAAVGLMSIIALVPIAAFTVASALLMVGVLLFTAAVALMLVTSIVVNNLDIGSVIGAMAAVFGGMIAVGLLSLVAMVPMAMFVAASALLMVGMVMFTASVGLMKLVSMMIPPGSKEETGFVGNMIGTMAAIFGGMIAVGLLATLALVPITLFTAASTVLVVGMAMFSSAASMMVSAYEALAKVPNGAFLGEVLGMFALLVPIGIMAAISLVPIAAFSAASIALMIGMGAFQSASASMLKSWNALSQVPSAMLLLEMTAIFGLMIPLGIVAGLATLAIAPFSLAANLLSSGMTNMLTAVDAMLTISTKLPLVVPLEGTPPAIDAINRIFKSAKDIDIGPMTMLKIGALAISAHILAAAMSDARSIFDAVVSIQDEVDKLEARGISFTQLMEPFSQIFMAVAEAASGFQGMSKKAAEAMAIAIVPVTQAIDNLAHTITYLADFAMSPDYTAKMDAAKTAFNSMLKDFFGAGADDPPPTTVLGMLYGLKKMPKGAAEAAAALAPLTASIASVADTITKCAEMPPPDAAIAKLEQVMQFCLAMNKFASQFKGDAPGFLAGLTTSSEESMGNAQKALSSMGPVVDEIKSISERIVSVPDPGGAIAIVEKISAFCATMNDFTKIFSGGGLFSTDSTTQNGIASDAIKSMGPVIDSMKILVDNVSTVADTSGPQERVRSIMTFCEELNGFTLMFKPGGLFTKSSEDLYATAKNSIDAMVPVVDSMKTLSSRLNTVEEVGTSLTTLRAVFALAAPEDLASKGKTMLQFAQDIDKAHNVLPSNNKIKTLFDDLNKALSGGQFAKLNQVAQGTASIANSVSQLNTALTKLRSENSATMEKVKDMNKGSGLGGLIAGIGGGSGGGGSAGQAQDYRPVLNQILESTQQIVTNTTKETDSTMFSV